MTNVRSTARTPIRNIQRLGSVALWSSVPLLNYLTLASGSSVYVPDVMEIESLG